MGIPIKKCPKCGTNEWTPSLAAGVPHVCKECGYVLPETGGAAKKITTKHWKGEVNGFAVQFDRDDVSYGANVLLQGSLGPIIRVYSALSPFGGWTEASVDCPRLDDCSVSLTKRYAEALDVAWRIAAGINEELGIENPPEIDVKERFIGMVKPTRFQKEKP